MPDVYGVILAGGIGKRMGGTSMPKQFLELKGKPVIIRTAEAFLGCSDFQKILVVSHPAWVPYTEELLAGYLPGQDRLKVIAGGETRNETIMNAIRFLEEEGLLTDETVIVTHDAVRPFVSQRILADNIACACRDGACDTVIPATDTIVASVTGETISSIPDRSHMYQGQTPQSFRARKLREVYLSLTEEEKQVLTDACKIMVMKGERVVLVEGDLLNMKITHNQDLCFAEAIAEAWF